MLIKIAVFNLVSHFCNPDSIFHVDCLLSEFGEIPVVIPNRQGASLGIRAKLHLRPSRITPALRKLRGWRNDIDVISLAIDLPGILRCAGHPAATEGKLAV